MLSIMMFNAPQTLHLVYISANCLSIPDGTPPTTDLLLNLFPNPLSDDGAAVAGTDVLEQVVLALYSLAAELAWALLV